MQLTAETAFTYVDPNEWFDFWHTHPDWDGKGNSKPENRLRAIELTYSLLKKAVELTNHRVNDCQCWAVIEEDSAQNSVYIHTPNPNFSNFPFEFEGVEWGATNESMEKIIDSSSYEIGLLVDSNEKTYFIRKKA